ncbi:MAG: MucB/RseB C-terminal domain-containing protein [Thiohalorhabdus sp.]
MVRLSLLPHFAVLLAAVAVSSAEAREDLEAQVERMIQAARGMTYEGILVHGTSVGVESMRLYHRGESDGGFRERLVMLTGPARELVREADGIKRYHPEVGQVISGPRRSGTAIFNLAEKDLQRVRDHYRLKAGPSGRVAGREARAVEFRAEDGQRFTYRVWRDEATDLPLQTEVMSKDGKVMETFTFAAVSPDGVLDDGDLQLNVPEDARKLERRELGQEEHPPILEGMELPPGFRLDARFEVPGKEGGTHFFYTDGLATLSLFLEQVEGESRQGSKVGEILQRGALHACSVNNERYRVTLLGELPGPALRKIATSLTKPADEES